LTRVVLDASAGVEIALQTPDGLRIESLLPQPTTFWVPEHYFLEVAGVLRRNEINGRYPAARVQAALDKLLTSPTNSVAVKPLLSEAWTMRHNLTIADALYVVVAIHAGAVLATADMRLANAPNLPVETITP